MKSISAAIVACLLFASPAFADDDLAALVHDLGSEDFAVREAATQRLLAVGEPGRALLEQARGSADAEVRMRAERVLGVFDARRQLDADVVAARKAFAGDAARSEWLEALYLAARDDRASLAAHFADGKAPTAFWESARHCPLSLLADLTWVEAIPAKRMGWIEGGIDPGDIVVMGAMPVAEDRDALPDSCVPEPRALVLEPSGGGWRVRRAAPATIVGGAWSDLAHSDEEKAEWAVGVLTVQALWSQGNGVTYYDLAQGLDAVGDFEGAIRAYARCQPTGQWPDYCIVHRHFDLMRLGRKEEAAKVLREQPGAGGIEYLSNVIRWLRGEMTLEALKAWAKEQGSYEQDSLEYYFGMERLLAGDAAAARGHLTWCADHGSGCYEAKFAHDALELLDRRHVDSRPAGEPH